ncbi:MAG: VWA domain-containing protein [Gemmatimonadota bacterium]
MRFEYPAWIWASVIGAMLGIVLLTAWYHKRRRALDLLGSMGMLERLTRIDLPGSPARRGTLIATTLALLGLALAGPQWGAQEVEQQTRALSVVLAVDISESLWAEDVRPNRLERARLEGRRLVTELAGHRIGLVAFAGAAYRMSPLTVDHGAINLYLDALDPTMAGIGGSSLAAAIRESAALLREDGSEGGDRAIIILTDGEGHDDEEEVLAEARAASAAGIHIFAVGVGTERGEPIPLHDRLGGQIGGYKRDADGEVVLSRWSPEPLNRVAAISDGLWLRADEGGASRVVAALEELEYGTGSLTRGVRWTPRFQLFLAAAFLLLTLDWAWAWRWLR